MKTSKSSSKSKRSISRVHIGILLVVFIALSATISVLAFNASALPEGYTYVDGGGIYFFGDTNSYYSNDIVGVEILTTYDDVQAVSDADLASMVKYPELSYPFKQIEAYADDVCVARTEEYNFEFSLSELGITSKSGVSLLCRHFNNYANYIGNLYDTSSTRSYSSEASLKSKYSTASNFYYNIIGTDGTSFTVSSLEIYDVYNAMRVALGYADDEAYAPSYYKTYDEQEVLATYTLKVSSALKYTSFYIGDVKVPLKKDSYGNYFQPCYRLIYADGNQSYPMGSYYDTLSVCSGDPIFAFCEFGGMSTVSTCTPDGENRIIDYLVGSSYTYRTILPAVVTFEYDLDDDVVDANDPTLEEDSRIDPIYTTKLVDTQNSYVTSVKLDDGKNISKGQSHLDKWVVGVPSQQVIPGDAMAVCVNGSSGYETIDGAIYAGLDANTGAFKYYYRITATWRDYTKLRYDLNISQSVNYVQGSDGSYYSYYYTENDPVFYDDGEYSETVPATLTSTTYAYDGDTYVFAGWTKDFRTGILKKTSSGYVDAAGNSYTADQFLNYNADDPSANEINMSEDHTLYAAWAIADDKTDDFIKVTAKITNGKFVFESINDDNYTYYPSSSWLSATGGSTFVDKNSYENPLIFVSVPNDGYNAYKYKYHLGTAEVTNGYGNVPLLLGSSYQGHGDNLSYSNFYDATSDEEYYYEIEYVKYGPCVLTFYKNEPGNSDPYDTTCYSVNDLYYSMEYDLSKYYEIQDDGSVKLLNVKDSQSFDSISDASYQVDGYNFVGWARLTTDDAGYPTYDESKLLTSISFKESTGYYMDLVAVWEAPKPEYDVIYYTDTDKGTVLDTQSYPADSEVTVGLSEGKSNPTKTGYTFSGWNCVTSGVTVTDSKFTMPENAVELVPEWTANKHTVTYTVTGAPDSYTAPEAATVAYGTEVTVAATPSVTGYTFAGWTTTDVTVTSGKFTMPDKNVTLTGVFTANTLSVIYYKDTDKATALDTQAQTFGTSVTVGLSEGKSNPTKTGYTFKGWSCVTEDVEISNNKFTMPNKNVEFVPVWDVNKHTVTYTVTGAPSGYTAPTATTVAYGTEVTVADVPSVTGYTFAGWTTTDVTVTSGKFTMPDKNVTLTGVFTANTLSVIYYSDTDKSTAIDTQAQQYKTKVEVGLTSGVDEPTKEGCTFKGWTCVTTGVTVTNGSFTMPDKNVEFVPEWELNGYGVTYTVTGGPDSYAPPAAKVVDFGTEVTVEAVPSVTGYTFAGWTCETEGVTVTDGKFTMPAKNVAFTGVFTPKNYNVVYYSDTDKATVVDTQSQAYASAVTVGLSEGKSEPTKTGYSLSGWKCVTSGITVANGKFTMPAETVEFVPVWSVNQYTVTYTVTGGPSSYTPPAAKSINYNTTVTIASEPSLTGYTFSGWTTTDVTVTDGKFTMPAKNVTVTGTFTAIDYTIIYEPGKDDVSDMPSTDVFTIEGFVSGKRTLNGTPTHADYNFAGWSLDGTKAITAVELAKFTADNNNTVTVTALWTLKDPDNVSITYESGFTASDAADGDIYGSLTYTAAYNADYTVLGNENITDNPYFVRTGYTFAGWKITSAETAQHATFSTRATNFFSDMITVLSNVVTGGKVYNKGDVISGLTQNLVFTAQWTANQYTVVYNKNAGSDSVSGMPSNETKLTVENSFDLIDGKYVHTLKTATPTRTGYKFIGWSMSESSASTVTTVELSQFDADNSVTVYAVWEKLYRVYYDSNNATSGTAPKDSTWYNSGDDATVANHGTIARTGYSFGGWNSKADGSGTDYAEGSTFVMPAADVTLYANWIQNKYNLKYETGVSADVVVTSMPANEFGIEYELVKDGYALDDTTVPQREGYTFAGWKVGSVSNATKAKFSDFNNADMTAVATAQWTESIYQIVYNANSPTGDDANVTSLPSTAKVKYSKLAAGYTLSGAPKCSGYTFLGWSKTTDGAVVTTVDVNDITNGSDTINVYAKWEKTIYGTEVIYRSGFEKKYKYDVDGYYTDTVNDISQPYEILPNNWFSRKGYTFNGWYISRETGEVTVMDSLANMLNLSDVGDKYYPGDLTTISGKTYLTVIWELNKYNIKYDKNTSDEVTKMPKDELGIDVEENFWLNWDKDAYLRNVPESVPKREGYKFLGWSLAADSTDCIKYVNLADFGESDTLTLYAVWSSNKYKVVYNKNNSTDGTAPVDSNEYVVNDTVTVLDKGDLKCNDYTFKGWNTQKNGKGTYYEAGDTFSMPGNDVTLYAIWVTEDGTIVSPGTGESTMGIIIAVMALIISGGAGTAVILTSRRKKRA